MIMSNIMNKEIKNIPVKKWLFRSLLFCFIPIFSIVYFYF
jgi:hypothetical protein